MPDEKPTSDGVEVKLIWPLEDGIPTVYANQFSIAQPGPEIVLAFGAFLPNSFSNRPESEVRHYLQNAPVKVVAKVVVSQDGLQAFYNLLKNYFERKSEKGEQEK